MIFFSDSSSSSNQINCLVNHPTLPVAITAHEDRHIRFFDINTGKCLYLRISVQNMNEKKTTTSLCFHTKYD